MEFSTVTSPAASTPERVFPSVVAAPSAGGAACVDGGGGEAVATEASNESSKSSMDMSVYCGIGGTPGRPGDHIVLPLRTDRHLEDATPECCPRCAAGARMG